MAFREDHLWGGFGDNRYGSDTFSNNVMYSWQAVKRAEHEMRAAKAFDILDRVCAMTGHVGACGLLNDRYRFDIKIAGRYLAIPNPLYRMWLYIMMSSRRG